MTINVYFAELSDYIRRHYDKSLSFSKVSEQEVCVAYEQNIIVRTVQIPLNISIDEVLADKVAITYNGGFGLANKIIAGALSFMKAKLPEFEKVLVPTNEHSICIELSQLSQTKAIVEKMCLKEIKVSDDRFEIKALLK